MSLAKLTSVSTQTLSLLLERQRLMSMGQPSPSSHTQHIIRNLGSLRSGILAFEQASNDNRETNEACKLLRNQFERMRGMLGAEGDAVEPLSLPQEAKAGQSSSSSPSATRTAPSEEHRSYTPYRDDAPPSPDMDPSAMLEQQQLLMTQQDTHLDNLALSVGRQRDISLQINDELETHTGLLEALDEDLDNTSSRLSNARKRLDRFSRGLKGNWSTYTIAGLILILLILIIIFKT